jgi:saccharopine dehydrogenase (NAD+, L-lysine-forming)
MNHIKIGILREGKVPPDKRVALKPDQCLELQKLYPNISIYIQPSDIRAFSNSEYTALGLPLSEDLSHCDILFGIKEVPPHLLIPNKTYFFFSHTLKKQSYNQKLLQTILEKKIELIDYEVLTDSKAQRLIAFGKFAGIVGCYNAFLLYGRKHLSYELKPAHKCFDLEEASRELEKVVLPPIKIVATGTGRVGQGFTHILDKLNVKKVSPEAYLNETFAYPVYCLLSSSDYYVRKDQGGYNREEFYSTPELYESNFKNFLIQSEIFLAGAYWDPRSPVLFTRQDMVQPDFKVDIIADVTCDINGSIPSTLKPCTIPDPAYDYNPLSHTIEPPFSGSDNVTVMAIDNLPGELPRDASRDFGKQLMSHVFPLLSSQQDPDGILERGTMTSKDGCLTERFSYLTEYAQTDRK